ncbi:hypothetical protein IKQ26_07085 [bacterium]|nr:hypothetical protein [bacterium]
MQKKLAIAFVWHMHQPNYQTQPNSLRLMPWARLHAVKDYLNMVAILEKHPDIKLNFNISPILIDTILDYSKENNHDLHSKLTVTPVEELTENDKLYILNSFFDVDYNHLISKYKEYVNLYNKRYSKSEINVNDFSDKEYGDIMFWFNFVWFDEHWKNEYPALRKLEQKGQNFTLKDRKLIIDIQRKIISKIIPTWKKYLKENRIGISVSPYYHPILPILINANDIKTASSKYSMPDCKINMADDARTQLEKAINRFEEVFGETPKGCWPSELCLSKKTVEMLADMGFKWTISEDSTLADSLRKEFVRDYKGCLEEPYDLASVYSYETKNKNEIKLIFRDSIIAKLISFEYPQHDSIDSANDLYERIKIAQDKLRNSPDKTHLLTIAMDGENSWDSYEENGSIFLNHLYKLIAEDSSLETVIVNEYIEKNNLLAKCIDRISVGSSANNNYQFWIAEPTKNVAWTYIQKAKELINFCAKDSKYTKNAIAFATRELQITQGSDWFWWYGEPNNSGQDHVFDYMFREHLKNIYVALEKEIPEYLQMPLISIVGKPSRVPKRTITPCVNGIDMFNDEWQYAGCIDIPAGPVLQEYKLFNRICFGCDSENLYLRFDINQFAREKGVFKKDFAIYIYIKALDDLTCPNSPVRVIVKKEENFPILYDTYTHEVKFWLAKNPKYPYHFAKAAKDGTWELEIKNDIRYGLEDIFEVSVPFDDLKIPQGKNIGFFIIKAIDDVIQEVYPKDIPLTIQRP